jgi:hypothetical protein
VQRLHGDLEAIAQQLHSDCTAIPKRLYSDLEVIAIQFLKDCKVLAQLFRLAIARGKQSNFSTVVMQSHSDCIAIAQRLKDNQKSIAIHLYCSCRATVLIASDCNAIVKRLRSG